MKFIRLILGKIILFLDAVFTPKQEVVRSPEQQAAINGKTQAWTLYQLPACPFCVKVRRQMKRLGLVIPLKDIHQPEYHQELMMGGKVYQVPCLRYLDLNGQTIWLYESTDINNFLKSTFTTA